MIIHLTKDSKFINKSINRFEYYYPDNNIFFVHLSKKSKGSLKNVHTRDVVQPINFTRKKSINKIISQVKDGDHLLIHGLNSLNAAMAIAILKKKNIKTYWLFYGADLYDLLQRKNVYQLFDNLNIVDDKRFFLFEFLKKLLLSLILKVNLFKSHECFIKQLNYFCFWNHNDYLLLKTNFNTRACFKYFRYYDVDLNNENLKLNKKQNGSILINHSASKSGNHLTLLSKIKGIDSNNELKKIYVPLSYGSKKIQKEVLNYGNSHLSYCFYPILNYLDLLEYYSLISQVEVALFGHRRQEGGNNIYSLLASGAKVFLRKENNLLQYLKDKGYYVYDLDIELNTIKDLEPLHIEMQRNNRCLALKEFSQNVIDEVYQNFIVVGS